MALTPEQWQEHVRMVAIKERIEGSYLAREDVTGVGVGFKERHGVPGAELAIRFYVKHKGDVPDERLLPATIEGYATDVIEAEFRFDSSGSQLAAAPNVGPDTKRYDPLIGGISMAPSRLHDSAGTLGLMVRDANTGGSMMLSNFHVMCLSDGKYKAGDEMCQEARSDNIWGWCGNCAALSRWQAGNVIYASAEYGIDAAVAAQTHRKTSISEVEGVGKIAGHKSPELDMQVWKRGRTTELTSGMIDDISATIKKDFGVGIGEVDLKRQILVKGDPPPFSDGGDSGAVYVDQDSLKVVGLHWGRTVAIPPRGVGNWIAPVLNVLHITIPLPPGASET